MLSRFMLLPFLAASLLPAQTDVASQSVAPGITLPAHILQCEAADDSCTLTDKRYSNVWSFEGTEGTAQSAGVVAGTRLTIEKFDGANIVVRRFDKAGATAGLSGLYTGKIEGKQITGTVKWSWINHPGFPASGYWSGVVQDPPASQAASGDQGLSAGIPPRLLECEGAGPCNGAWTFSQSEGSAIWYGPRNVRAKLAVIRFEANDVYIRRTDTSDGGTAVYSGARHGNQISGTVVWSRPDHPGQASGVWSATIPDIVCDSNANLAPQDAIRIGQNALMFHLQREALDCYVVAAAAGDVTAQTIVGMIYYQGKDSPVAQDYKQALFWLGKAAGHGNYAAQRTLAEMYMLGQGTARDVELSHYYAGKADEQKRERERQQDRAADQSRMLSSFVMGAVVGALLF